MHATILNPSRVEAGLVGRGSFELGLMVALDIEEAPASSVLVEDYAGEENRQPVLNEKLEG